ncbi:extracellular solute-binding protein [Cohnella sp. GCM10027633]|uniref:extracellular solute-binding protein n=1 Tax=unclassified Cohnella TaxID=2636738 RepID=UPI003630AD8A
MSRKWVGGSMSAVLLGTLLAGCGGGNDNNDAKEPAASPSASASAPAPSQSESAAPEAGEKIKIEALKVGWGTKMPADDFVKKNLDEKLNIDLELTLPGNTDEVKNQLSTRIAASDPPDIMELVDRNHLLQLANMGALLDLTPYLNDLPNVKQLATEEGLKKGVVNGKTYALAKAPTLLTQSYWIRKDWLTNLNLPMPTTFDELLEVAKAFAEKDPDGNGKKDTLGMTAQEWLAFNPIFGSYGVGSSYKDIYIKDGQAISAVYDPAYRDALASVKKLLDAGVVDPELFSNKGAVPRDKAITGQAGIIYTDFELFRDEHAASIKAANPNAEWAIVPSLTGPGGQFESSYDLGGSSGFVALPKSLDKDPDKVKRILQLLDHVSHDEGLRLVEYGLEGTHFTLKDGKAEVTDKITESSYSWVYQLMGRPEKEYLSTKFPKQAPQIQEAAAKPRLNVYNGFIDPPATVNLADAQRFMNDELLKFAFGKSPMSEYDKFLSTLDTTYGYKQYIEEANKQLKALGFLN